MEADLLRGEQHWASFAEDTGRVAGDKDDTLMHRFSPTLGLHIGDIRWVSFLSYAGPSRHVGDAMGQACLKLFLAGCLALIPSLTELAGCSEAPPSCFAVHARRRALVFLGERHMLPSSAQLRPRLCQSMGQLLHSDRAFSNTYTVDDGTWKP